MKNKRKKRIYRDKNGREFIKHTCFAGGKMKHYKIYVIDGIPVDDFYGKNATDLDFYLNGDYELMGKGENSKNQLNEQNNEEVENLEDLPF